MDDAGSTEGAPAGDEVEIRAARPEDAAALAEVFWQAVQVGSAAHYGPAERAAWLPEPPSPPVLAARLAAMEVPVALVAGTPVGFMALAPDGFLDLAYVHPDHARQGIGRALHEQVLRHARDRHLPHLRTQASRVARPFFAGLGWRVVRRLLVERNGIALESFEMELPLVSDPG